MKISLQAVLDAAAALYRLLLKGRTVKVGGQDIVLPNQTNTPFASGQSPFDSKPHMPQPPSIGPRR